MNIDNEIKLDFDDVLLVPQRSTISSRQQVELSRKFKFYHSPKDWHGLPLMAANMDTTGTFQMGTALSKYGAITCLHKHYDADTIADYFKYYNIEKHVWISIGMDLNELPKINKIAQNLGHAPNICIDIANGYTERFTDWCASVRQDFPESIMMAGNVCTPDMVSELILHGGVDIVKIGIGPGSACTTRLKAGVGYPQLSAIAECSHAAHGIRSGAGRLGLICADGGCRYAADITKAYAAGADFVMLGGMIAGSEECEGEWELDVDDEGQEYKTHLTFYGMSSEKAQQIHGDSLRNYRSSEGRVLTMPYKGPVNNIIQDIAGGIRSACAYTGATCLKDFSKTAKFVRVNRTHYDQTIEKI